MTRVLEQHPEVGLDSYDRIIPCQDTLPKGGFGNLIALPLQAEPRKIDNSVFVKSHQGTVFHRLRMEEDGHGAADEPFSCSACGLVAG